MSTPVPAPEPAPVADFDELEAAFRRIGHLLKRSMRDVAATVHPELRVAGWSVLGFVLRCGREGHDVTVGDIIAETGMDKSVVSRQLRSLSDWGLVELRRSDQDARVVVVAGTPLAYERLALVRQRQRERYEQILGGWDGEDVDRLSALLNRVADGFAE